MKKKIAILIMVDGAVVGEKYFECIDRSKEEWDNKEDELMNQAQWFFY